MTKGMMMKKRILMMVAALAVAVVSCWAAIKANVASFGHADFTSASGVAYTAGDTIGTAQQLTVADYAGRVLLLDQVLIRDGANQKKGVRFYFFDVAPPAQTDNAAFAIGAALPNLIGVVDVRDGDYLAVDTAGVVTQPMLYKMVAAGPTIWVVAVCQPDAGAPTYGVGGKLSVDFHFSY